MNRMLGSALLIAGTTVGAGMIALPVTLYYFGFLGAVLSFIVVWAMSLIASYLILDVNLTQPEETNLVATATAVLGRVGGKVNAVAYIVLLYALCAAYTTGLQSMASTALALFTTWQIPASLLALGIVAVAIWVITRPLDVVDRINRILMIGLIVSFVAFIVSATMKIDFSGLLHVRHLGTLPLTWPILLTSFGYHIVIPATRRYLQGDVKAIHKAFWVGTLLPLAIYLLWMAATIGIVPEQGAHGFAAMTHSQQPAVDLGFALHDITHKQWLPDVIEAFSLFAIITSFLGVSLALYDYLRHAMRKKTWAKPLVVALITLVPAWLFGTIYPHGFILALEYAAINVAIISMVIPALMVFKAHGQAKTVTGWSRLAAVVVMLFGVLIIGLAVFDALK